MQSNVKLISQLFSGSCISASVVLNSFSYPRAKTCDKHQISWLYLLFYKQEPNGMSALKTAPSGLNP
jgi:hypothetical protein